MDTFPTSIRQEFPFFDQTDVPAYFDTASTAQKPKAVITRMQQAMTQTANVHRGLYPLAEQTDHEYEQSRKTVQKYVGATHAEEIVYTRSTTEAINLVARCWGETHLQEKDVLVLSLLEHHSNIVPWQQIAASTGCTIKWLELDEHMHPHLDQLETFLQEENVRMVAITALSNVTGTIVDTKTICRMAHDADALCLVDAAQLIAHHPMNVQDIDCDFLTFSSHKVYGPTGIGVLYGKKNILTTMPGWLGGGGMIGEVTQQKFTDADVPTRFEGGTPPIAEAIALGAALEWIQGKDWKTIEAHEQHLYAHAHRALSTIEGIRLLSPEQGSACISFTIDGTHPHDLADILGQHGYCLRAGHHCAQPLHTALGIPASLRMSFGIYNTIDEVNGCVEELQKAVRTFTN